MGGVIRYAEAAQLAAATDDDDDDVPGRYGVLMQGRVRQENGKKVDITMKGFY